MSGGRDKGYRDPLFTGNGKEPVICLNWRAHSFITEHIDISKCWFTLHVIPFQSNGIARCQQFFIALYLNRVCNYGHIIVTGSSDETVFIVDARPTTKLNVFGYTSKYATTATIASLQSFGVNVPRRIVLNILNCIYHRPHASLRSLSNILPLIPLFPFRKSIISYRERMPRH